MTFYPQATFTEQTSSLFDSSEFSSCSLSVKIEGIPKQKLSSTKKTSTSAAFSSKPFNPSEKKGGP